MEESLLILIPARGGSKSIPKKNLVDLCGKPLVEWTILQAVQVHPTSNIVLSSDDKDILEVGKKYGIICHKRPTDLSSDTASTESLMVHILNKYRKVSSLMVLQPTSPLKLSTHIEEAYHKFKKLHAGSLFSATKTHYCSWEWNKIRSQWEGMWPKSKQGLRMRRQDWPESVVENGAIYIVDRCHFLLTENRFCGSVEVYQMPSWTRFEVDSREDLGLVRIIMATRWGHGCNGVTT